MTSSSYNIADYYFSEPIVAGETYAISLKGTLGEGKIYFGIYNSGGSVSMTSLYPSDKGTDGIFRKNLHRNRWSKFKHIRESLSYALFNHSE